MLLIDWTLALTSMAQHPGLSPPTEGAPSDPGLLE
jgi:hypothetical protein